MENGQTASGKSELLLRHGHLLYRTANMEYGCPAPSSADARQRHAIPQKFSSGLAVAGMFKNNGLNTRVTPERYMEGSKDWMDHLN